MRKRESQHDMHTQLNNHLYCTLQMNKKIILINDHHSNSTLSITLEYEMIDSLRDDGDFIPKPK